MTKRRYHGSTSVTVDVDVDWDDIIPDIRDEDLIAECQARGIATGEKLTERTEEWRDFADDLRRAAASGDRLHVEVADLPHAGAGQRTGAEGAAPGMSESEATIPEGWQLGAESWRFHRQFFVRVGRPAAHAEYAAIIAQIRCHIAPRLDRYHYQVTLADGTPLIVSGSWHKLNGVERPDWTPKPPKPVKAAAPPPEAQPAIPPPAKPLRASTLTLGNPAAAKALAERLRRFGIPPPASNHASPP